MRASERRFRFLAESIPQMVWTAGPEGWVDYATPRSLEWLAVSPEQILGWSWMDLLHPDDRRRTAETWEQALREGTEYRHEYRFRYGATGEYRWFLAHARSAAGRRRPDRRLVWHLHRHRRAMACPPGNRAAQPRPRRPRRRVRDPDRDDPDRHRHRRGCRRAPAFGRTRRSSGSWRSLGFQHLPVGTDRGAARQLPDVPRRAGTPARGAAHAGGGADGTARLRL